MRFAFDDDQLALRDAVRDLLADQCTPDRLRAVWDDGSGVLPEVWAKLAGMGVVGMTAPEAAGGLGMGALEWVLVFEEAGRVALPGPLVETTAVAIPLLAGAGEREWLAPLASGDAIAAVGLDGLDLVAHASQADMLVLRDAEGGAHLVDGGDVEVVAVDSVDHGRPLGRVTWSPSPSTHVADAAAVDDAFDRGALATAATLVGLGQALLDAAVEYAKARHQFGVPIGSYQAVKHHLADVALALAHARPCVHAAAWHVATGTPERGVYVSLAKARASDAAVLASRQALQVHGAIGYTWEHDLHLIMKRAWVLAAAWGDAAFHRRRIEAYLLRGQ